MSLLGGFFGGGGNPPPTYTSNNTVPPHAGGAIQPGTIVMTDNIAGLNQLQQMQRAYTASQGANSTTVMLSETGKLLTELMDELESLKEWLIATYPDIYQQYKAVRTLREIGREK